MNCFVSVFTNQLHGGEVDLKCCGLTMRFFVVAVTVTSLERKHLFRVGMEGNEVWYSLCLPSLFTLQHYIIVIPENIHLGLWYIVLITSEIQILY